MNLEALDMYKTIVDVLEVPGAAYMENQVNWEMLCEGKFYSRIILSYRNNETTLIIQDEEYINECIMLDNDKLIYSVIGHAHMNGIKILKT